MTHLILTNIKMLRVMIILFVLFGVNEASPISTDTCGYASCPDAKQGDVLNIHLVAHTHDDVGWLKTYEQYYYGLNSTIQKAGVQYILDSVIEVLLKDSKKRFIYVETAFFWKWWLDQDSVTQEKVKKLVNNGQLEFIGGAWSMHDEAAAHYQSMLDQTTWGFRKLEETFGKCGKPKVGWQIDPFGHSKVNANLMANYGFDGLFLGRIDWQDKKWRINKKTMEMIWHTSSSDDNKDSRLFTGVLYNVYAPPKGFCFDIMCNDEPIVDDVKSVQYNAMKRAEEFVESVLNISKAYRTNNVLITMGEDFHYQDAHVNFKNMDKLIREVNKISVDGRKMNAFYSTPSCYLKAVNDKKPDLPGKYDDFMPYSSDEHSFWTGYYTSRPTLKLFERQGNNFLQVCKQLHSLSGLNTSNTDSLDRMREAMGIMQHHDAITGTEKQHVADDYARILTDAFKHCSSVTQDAFDLLMPKKEDKATMTQCLLRNISVCDLTENSESFVVNLYNPLSHEVDHLVRLPVLDFRSSYFILDPAGETQDVQIIPLSHRILGIQGRNSNATGQLIFLAKNIPPLGYKSYFVRKEKRDNKMQYQPNYPSGGKLGYKDVYLNVGSNGDIKSTKSNDPVSTVDVNFYIYEGVKGNNKISANRLSGAYIFRPNGPAKPVAALPKYVIEPGPILTEYRRNISDWISQTLTIRHDVKSYFEVSWQVGPIPISHNVSQEVVVRIEVNGIKNNGIFLTDSNGREYIERKLNTRSTWDVELFENISGNYYPVTTTISIADKDDRVSVITDRAQGATSLDDGVIELMVHRRLLHDDAFGVGEALNETAFGEGLVAVGSHYITLGNITEVRKLVQSKVLDSWIFLSPTEGKSFEQWKESFNMKYSGLKEPLPANIQILTLEPWKDSSYLLRLEHIFAANDDPFYSKPVTVDLKNIFSNWDVQDIKEVKLGADRTEEEVERMCWYKETSGKERNIECPGAKEKCSETKCQYGITTLYPMQIKTFIIKIANIKYDIKMI